MRGFLAVLSIYSYMKVRKVVQREPFLAMNERIWCLHLAALGTNYIFQVVYEISFIVWLADSTSSDDLSHGTLVFLALVELGYNASGVLALLLLAYMMDRMTDLAPERFTEPVLNRQVPFFVHLASVKLLNDFLVHGDESASPGWSPTRSLASHPASQPASLSGGAAARASLKVERELQRVIEAYTAMTNDPKWNPRVISLAMRLIRLEFPTDKLHPNLAKALRPGGDFAATETRRLLNSSTPRGGSPAHSPVGSPRRAQSEIFSTHRSLLDVIIEE